MNTEHLKQALEAEKTKLEKQLATFAVEDPNLKGNWDAKPVNSEDTDMEEKADEAQEYDNRVSLEHSLELKLKDVNAALEKMAHSTGSGQAAGTYGTCEKCGKKIEEERLLACPEARLCMGCNAKS